MSVKGSGKAQLGLLSFYNIYVVLAPSQVATSCVSKRIDVLMMTYDDDLLNLNKVANPLPKNFDVLIASFWKYLFSAQCAKVKVLFFRFVKLLLKLPHRMMNSNVMRNSGISDPLVLINHFAEKFLKNAQRRANPWPAILSE